MSKARLRQAVLRDLAWLFNTTRLESSDRTWRRVPYARRSVINFGLPALSGQTASSLDVDGSRTGRPSGDPRLRAAHPARVAASAGTGRARRALDHHNVIGVEIHGQLWAQPVPLELLVRTEIDLETGKVADR